MGGFLLTRNMSCIVAAVSLYCSDAPDLVFPEPGDYAVISGRVLPALASTRVCLLRAAGPDTTNVDTVTEMFEFRDVPFGTYYLHADAPGYGTAERVIVADKPVVGVSDIKLTSIPRLIYDVSPDDGTVIDSAFISTRSSMVTATDIVVKIYFREIMDTASVRRALRVSPPMEGAGCGWESGPNGFDVTIPRAELDGADTLVITVDTAAADRFGHHLERDFTVSYPVAGGLGSVVPPPLLLSSTFPGADDRSVPPATDVLIEFDSLMHEASVEKAFRIHPQVDGATQFQWEYSNGKHRMRVIFPKLLTCGTWYTVLLEAGWMNVDSTMKGSSYSFRFETQRPAIAFTTPRNGETRVNPRASILFRTNFLTDKKEFLRAFAISPTVDSLSCTVTSGDVSIGHAPFDSGTTYTVAIDSTLPVPGYGTFGRMSVFSFTTLPKSDTAAPGDTVVWTPYPANGKTEVPVNQQFSCIFRQPIDSSKVGGLITLQPQVSFYSTWTSGNRCDIKPMHHLRSGTTYMISIDSGYQLPDSIIGKQVRWSITTTPLRCIGHAPPYGMVNADRTAPIVLAFNAPVDEKTLVNAVAISPAVTGLAVDSSTDETSASGGVRWSYRLSHDAFLPDTAYTVTVDTSVTDLFGTKCRDGATFTFSTGE